MSIIIYLFEFQLTTNVFSKSKIFKFLKRDCGTIPVAKIISGKIEIFSKHQRFFIATESSKYLFFFFFFFFFKLPFPFFAIRLLRYLSVGRFSNSCSLFLCLSVMRRGSGALSPATHAHSTSHSQTYTTTFIHPWAPFPTGLEPVLTSRWWPKEC
jgi:hypothetical protein